MGQWRNRWQALLVASIAVPLCLEGELRPIRTYTTADGLADDEVRNIVADSRGFVWFCSREGLSRFDGYRITNFGTAEGLPHRSVYTLLETRSGTYFLGTAGGLCQFHTAGSGNKTTTYRPGDDPDANVIASLSEGPSGRIWCGTSRGVFEVLSGPMLRKVSYLPSHGVNDILEDKGGNLWVATENGIYVDRKDGAVQHITEKDGLPSNTVSVLLQDTGGRLWVGTRGGLALMRTEGPAVGLGVRQIYNDRTGLPHSTVSTLAEGRDGSIWIGTARGVSRLLPGREPAALQTLTRANGLIDRAIHTLAVDKAGNIWAGTPTGVMRIEPAGFTTFAGQDGLPTDRVVSVFADRSGTLLTVTAADAPQSRALNVFDGVMFRTVSRDVFSDNPTWGDDQILVQSRTREWWVATGSGLCRFGPASTADLAGKQPKARYAKHVLVYRVFEDSKDGVWASGQSGQGDRLLRWDPAKREVSWLKGGPNRQQLVRAFAEDHDGNVWMGLFGGGELYCYDGREFTVYKTADGVPAAGIRALLVDHSGRLWIGSFGDGLRVLENPGRPFRLRKYDTASGLISNYVRALVEDNAGSIYVCTGKGIDRLNPTTGRIKHFSSADGLPRGGIESAFRDRFGDLWFATAHGASRLTPTADLRPKLPTVLITALRIRGKALDPDPVSQAGETRITGLRLGTSQNQLQAEFAGFNDELAENLYYTYTLDGADEGWSQTREHSVNYASLAPGTYRFLVKAVNSEGAESPTPAEIDFTVLPPFWRRWWFQLLALLTGVSLLYGAHRYNVNRLLELERVRTRIATDLHDDIGSSLSQVAILSEVVRRRIDESDPEINGPLSRIANISRDLVDSMSDIVWAINPAKDKLYYLSQRMREFASDVFIARDIDFQFRASRCEHELGIGAEARRQVFLIFKECIHNVVRHANCTQVEIDLSVESDRLVVQVRDNGRGFEPTAAVSGHGLESIRDRAQRLGGRIDIATDGQGTAVTLEVRLAQMAD